MKSKAFEFLHICVDVTNASISKGQTQNLLCPGTSTENVVGAKRAFGTFGFTYFR